MRVPGIGGLQRLGARLRRYLSSNAIILMYHQVADLDADPWGLSVSPAHFEEHLRVLAHLGTVISLSQLVEALTGGRLPRRAVIVTFDDGYADNVDVALPFLEQHSVQATVFLTSGAIDRRREFWWDELGRILLQPGQLPAVCELQGPSWTYRIDLQGDAIYSASQASTYRAWRAWEEPPTKRHRMYAELWQRLYQVSDSEKTELLDRIVGWAGVQTVVRSNRRLVSLDEAKRLAHSSVIEIGAHTVTHPPLSKLSSKAQAEEIQQSKSAVEELLNRPVRFFAYPHGDYARESIAAVQNAGFNAATCSGAGLRRCRISRTARRMVVSQQPPLTSLRRHSHRDAGARRSQRVGPVGETLRYRR